MQHLERGTELARSIALVRSKRPGGTQLAEVRLDRVDVERRLRAVGRAQQLDELGHAAGVVAEMRRDPRRRVGAAA